MKIDHTLISADALRGVIESFVEREGTDYGAEYSLEQKVAQVKAQLDKGTAILTFDEESESINEIEEQSSVFINLISRSNDFNLLIIDPTNKKEDQLNVIMKISEQYKLNNLLTKFLSFLTVKRRLFFVEKILKNFIETCSKKRGEIVAKLTAAKELNDNEVNNIKEELTKNFSSKIKLQYKFDPSLIGGLIIQVGSTMIDTSIKNKLQQLENKMIGT